MMTLSEAESYSQRNPFLGPGSTRSATLLSSERRTKPSCGARFLQEMKFLRGISELLSSDGKA